MKKPHHKASESQPFGKKPLTSEIGRAVDSILLETPGAALLPIAPRPQGESAASFFGRRREYYITKNGRTLLTQSGKLKLALARLPEKKGIDVRQLVDFARSALERECIRLIGRHKPGMLAHYHDPMKALCVLRIIQVPLLCHAFVNEMAATENKPTMQLWLGYYAALYKACERNVSERAWQRQSKTTSRSEQIHRGAGAAKLSPRPEFDYDYFDDSPAGYQFWLDRFDQWRIYAVRSLDYYVSKQSIDVRQWTGVGREAAIIGLLKKLDSFPERFFAESEWMQFEPLWEKIILRNARASRYTAEPPSIAKDTWLIEVWPLVVAYGWKWHDLAKVFHAKFDLSGLSGSAKIKTAAQGVTSAESDQTKDRCKQLGLHLAPAAMKPGRPKKPSRESTAVVPHMGVLALQIEGIGSALDWILGESRWTTNK